MALALPLLASCSDDGPPSSGPTTTAPTAITSSTTSSMTAASSTSAAGGPTTTGPAVGPWTPACRDTSRPPSADAARTFPTFGPLADRPAITVALPRVPNHPTNGPRPDGLGDPAAASASRVDGGVLLALGPSSSSDDTSSMVALVDHGGTVRWTRCLTGRVSGAWSAPGADRVLVVTSVYTDRPLYTVQWLSIADGRPEDAPLAAAPAQGIPAASLDRFTVVASTERAVLLAPDDHRGFEPLLRVDLATGALAFVQPVPGVRVSIHGDAGAPDCQDPTYALSPGGAPVVLAGVRTGGGAATSIWTNGGWAPATTAQRDAFGTRLAFCDSDRRARAYAPDGTLRWTATLPRPGLEGPLVATGTDVVVMAVCQDADPAAIGNCNPVTVALDLATGTELWRSATLQFLPAGTADGFVLASRGDPIGGGGITGWELLDARRGTAVSGQRWDDRGAFYQGCCGDSELYRVQRLGGIVVVIADTEVRIWYPRAAAGPAPVTLTLPPV